MRTLNPSSRSISAINLANEYKIIFPEKNDNQKRRNFPKDIWNRDLFEDFASFDTIRKCVLYCLTKYRANNEKDDAALKRYLQLLNMPYEEKFSRNSISDIQKTLKAWNMDTRGSSLAHLEEIESSLNNMRNIFDQLNTYTLEDFLDNAKVKQIEESLLRLFNGLKISKNDNQFVAISKTLHFILPNLFIPIDRTYTVSYFTNYRVFDVPKEREKQVAWIISFHRLFAKLYKSDIHHTNFELLKNRVGLPITKLLDDMLIGFAMYRNAYITQFNPTRHIL